MRVYTQSGQYHTIDVELFVKFVVLTHGISPKIELHKDPTSKQAYTPYNIDELLLSLHMLGSRKS